MSEAGLLAAAGPGPIRVTPHNCFACGTLNAQGMQLRLHAGDDACWTELVLDRRFEGWDGIAHGGIVATILDEVMAWALVDRDVWGVTARMAVDYRRPVPVGRRIRGEGRVLDARRRVSTTAATLVDAEDGTLLATAEGTYVAVPAARRAELEARYRLVREPAGTAAGGR